MVGSCQTVLQFSSTAFVITYKISTRVNISLRPGRGGSEEGSGFQGDSTRSLLLSRHRLVTVKHQVQMGHTLHLLLSEAAVLPSKGAWHTSAHEALLSKLGKTALNFTAQMWGLCY